MLRLALTPRWLAGLAVVLALAAIFITLSLWQVNRAEHKNDATQSADASTVKDFNDVMSAEVPMPGYLAHQRVKLRGHFLPDDQVIVVNQKLDGRSGFWVVTMFVPDGAKLGADAQVSKDKQIAIPVVRGFTASRAAAHDSRATSAPVELTATVGPIQAPVRSEGLRDGEVSSVSTSQLVNFFDVYSYSGFLYPDAQPEATVAGKGLAHVALAQEESGGVDLQSAAYAVEWIVFAGFALYIWWRLLRDDYLRRRETEDTGPAEYVVVKRAGERGLRQPGDGAPRMRDKHTEDREGHSSSDE